MKYEDDFDSKWGFNDGDSIPPDARQVRSVYVFAFNNIADILGLADRLVPLDRCGMHNCYLLGKTTEEALSSNSAPASCSWEFADGPGFGEWKQPASHWEEVSLSDMGEEVLGYICGEGTDGTDVGYEFVNSRNQIAKRALEKWVRRAAFILRKSDADARKL